MTSFSLNLVYVPAIFFYVGLKEKKQGTMCKLYQIKQFMYACLE